MGLYPGSRGGSYGHPIISACDAVVRSSYKAMVWTLMRNYFS